MAKKSFTAVFPRCDSDVGADGMAAVFNNYTDPQASLHICEIRTMIRPINPDVSNALGNQGIISIDRITAVTGGDEVVATKHDTEAEDLPAQVKLYENPDSVTISGTPFRRFGDCISSYTILKSISFQAMMRAPGICDTNDHTGRTCEGHNVWHADGDTDTQPIILNEGEGFCLTRREFGLPQAFHFGVTVRVVSTNRTYKYRDGDTGSSLEKGLASIALINGTGSGVVLQVMIVSLPDLGEENIPSYRVVRVVNQQFLLDSPGTAVTVTPHDTANTLTSISALRGPMRLFPAAYVNGVYTSYHDYQPIPTTIADQQRIDCFRRWLGAGPYITETGTVTLSVDSLARSEFEIWPGDRRGAISECELVLWPGQGVAIIGGGFGSIETSEQAYLDIEISGYVDEPATPAEIAAAVWTRAGRTLTA
jgi:hypothetical protein